VKSHDVLIALVLVKTNTVYARLFTSDNPAVN